MNVEYDAQVLRDRQVRTKMRRANHSEWRSACVREYQNIGLEGYRKFFPWYFNGNVFQKGMWDLQKSSMAQMTDIKDTLE